MSETQHASAQQGSVASTTANGQQVPDVAQWAAMQAFYKNSGAPQAPFLPPGFPPGSGAYATQFWGAGGPAPILYNPQFMSGLGGMNPYGFLQGAVSQPRHPDRIAEPGGVPPAKPSSKDLRQQAAQEANPKRPKRERSVADMKQAGDNVPEPSRSGSGGTASPASEPTSEQRNAGSAGASADFERQPSPGHIGASSSAQNLAAVGGGVVGGLQDEREVKKLRRKQSNRESARRSRLRKQAECEALSGKVAHLEQENGQLKDANRALMAQLQELQRMVSQTEQRGPQQSGLLKPVPGDGSAFTPVPLPARPAPESSTGVAAEHRSSASQPLKQMSELDQAAPQAPVAPTEGA